MALQKAAGGEKDALGKYHEQLVSDLNGIVEKVRGIVEDRAEGDGPADRDGRPLT